MDDKMTVYFKKENGDIVMVVGGIQDMNVFSDKAKYSELYSFILADYNSDVFNNTNKYSVANNNLIAKEGL